MGVGRGVAQTVPIVEEAFHEGNTGPGASARAARRRHLRRSGAWLPTTAWADPEIRAFVPSRYWFAYERNVPDTSRLPSPARELLQAALSNTCSVVTTDEARAIFQALAEAGISPSTNHGYEIGFSFSGPASYLHFSPALPDMKPC